MSDSEAQMLSLDTVREALHKTEPLGVIPISAEHGTVVRWRFQPDWAFTLDTTHGTAPVMATISVNGAEHILTKDAVLTAASAFGLPGAHAKQLPAHLLEQEMNYWFDAGIGKDQFNLLTVGADAQAAAFVKHTKQPFSNIALLDAVVSKIRQRMGNTAIWVDYKFNHSLARTDIRLVLPELGYALDQNDSWAAGFHISNSLIAKSGAQTSIEPYLFRRRVTSGATSQYGESGKWNRRSQGQQIEDVLAWAQYTVEDIFSAFPDKWAELHKLTEVNIEGNAEGILREVFRTYGVPYTQQNEIISDFGEADDLSMYELMQSIILLANNPTLKPERVDTLMRIGGSIPTALFDPLNRKLWEEGHAASPDAPNPYAVVAQ